MFVQEQTVNTQVSGTFTVPYSAMAGQTRTRISLQYSEVPGVCEVFYYGEVEDYIVNISQTSMAVKQNKAGRSNIQSLSGKSITSLEVYPNPAKI